MDQLHLEATWIPGGVHVESRWILNKIMGWSLFWWSPDGVQMESRWIYGVHVESIWNLWGSVKYRAYCTIPINLAGHITCYMPAEILNSAHERNVCYIDFFSADMGEQPCILSISQAGSTFQYFNILVQRALHNS